MSIHKTQQRNKGAKTSEIYIQILTNVYVQHNTRLVVRSSLYGQMQ